ncbi:AAA family ATPase [Marinomonas profundimaris]|uniref:Recombinase RecF n=1 Tax=Marinomonas profundimaris TaxID=1208321 RepID=W1RY35_9GAMM|nr:ATP-binding protein [Marinomonas profundimaris]ETI62126.1 recombinase RecF [Marinomonas profundimaris]
MLEELTIKNYKSISKLSFKLGRVNVFIGENGCGKSNILEAIALAGAADADKLDREFLLPRGIRATDPEDMISLFSEQEKKEIEINVVIDENDINFKLANNNKSYPNLERVLEILPEMHPHIDELKNNQEKYSNIVRLINKKFEKFENLEEIKKLNKTARKKLEAVLDDELKEIKTHIEELNSIEHTDTFLYKKINKTSRKLSNFLIYSPENSSLRLFYKEGQIEPLGINGEGLLKLLKVISKDEPDSLEEIKRCLNLFDWYKDFDIPSEFSEEKNTLNIFDKYIKEKNIDQRNANEGFLFVLFYMALIVSKDTPKIFAIDNIDASLNPKLCTRLIKEICNLSKEHNKQLFLTTHNPAILDGLDLNDPEQKLFVVSRNRHGHTRVKEVTVQDKPISSTGEPLRLSEAMLRGYLGGLPKGF